MVQAVPLAYESWTESVLHLKKITYSWVAQYKLYRKHVYNIQRKSKVIQLMKHEGHKTIKTLRNLTLSAGPTLLVEPITIPRDNRNILCIVLSHLSV